MRPSSAFASTLTVAGLIGFLSCLALQASSGEAIFSRDVVAAPRPARAKARAARRPVHHSFELDLDASMAPVAGTLNLRGQGTALLRVVDPTGHAIHESHNGSPFGSSRVHIERIEPASPGAHRIELELSPGVDASLELRRNAVVVGSTWPFATAAVALFGFLILMVRFAVGLHRNGMRRVALLTEAAATERA